MIYYPIVPDPTVFISPPGPIQGATVGSPLGIQCIVTTVSGVEVSSVMISWMGSNGNNITDTSRIIVNPVTSFGNNYTSGLHFIYLKEGDEGMYTCNVTILDNTQSAVIELDSLTCKYICIHRLVYYAIRNYILFVYICALINLLYAHKHLENP